MVIISVLPAVSLPGGYHLFVVQSSSMEPAIKTKSLVVVYPQIEYQTNEIITFLNPSQEGEKYTTTTHRLQMIINQNGKVAYMTKGDANQFSDDQFVPQDKVVGKVVKIIPYIGWLINIIKSNFGVAIFIFLPAAIIIRNEVVNVIDLTKKVYPT